MDTGVAMFPTHDAIGPGELAALVEERGHGSLWFPEHTHIPASRDSPFPGGGQMPRRYAQHHEADAECPLGGVGAAVRDLMRDHEPEGQRRGDPRHATTPPRGHAGFCSSNCFRRKASSASSCRAMRAATAFARRAARPPVSNVQVNRVAPPSASRSQMPRNGTGPSSLSITERRLGRCSVQTHVVSMVRPRKRRVSVTSTPGRSGPRRWGRTAIRLICQRGRLVGSARNAKTSSTGRWICSVCSKTVIAGRSFALTRPEIVTVRAVAPVDVMLLGPPRVERDGATVAFDTRKAVAMLAVLALAQRRRPRDVLAELLWPEHDAEHARGALRRTLSALRSAVGGEALEATRDQVSLVRGDGLRIDLDRFRAAAAAERLEEA